MWCGIISLVLAGGPLIEAVPVPYTPDTNTLFLFHFDVTPGSSVASNMGRAGGNAYGVNMSSASSAPPQASNIFGSNSYEGFGNAANLGETGYSIGFDVNGSGAYEGETIDTVTMESLNMGNGGPTPWTLEAMICPSVTNINQEIITTDSSAAARGFQFRLNKAGELELNLIALGNDIKTPLPASGVNAFVPNAWYHAAATYDGLNLRLYWTRMSPSTSAADLLSTTPAAVGANFGVVQGPLVVGNENRAVAGESFQGLIDEVRISDLARAATDMLASGIRIIGPFLTPTNDVIYCGTAVTLSATVAGTASFMSWQTDDSSQSGFTNLSNSNTNLYAINTTGMTPGTYSYRFLVTNNFGAVTSAVVKLKLAAASGPVLVSDTVITPSHALAGDSVVMSAQYMGSPPIYYQWLLNLDGGGRRLIPGATNAVYSIARVLSADAGSYSLMASNSPPGIGSRVATSSPALLIITNLAGDCSRVAKAPSGPMCELMKHPETTVITSPAPRFGWIHHPSFRNDSQRGYRIIVASSLAGAEAEVGDVWDSGIVTSNGSINIPYAGMPLLPGTAYFWRVKTVDSCGQLSPLSVSQQFTTAAQLYDPLQTAGATYQLPASGSANCNPLKFVPAAPVLVAKNALGHWFIDFGKAAFGYATVHLNGNYNGTNVGFGLGELASNNIVNTTPGSTIRYRSGNYLLQKGDVIYTNRSSTSVGTIRPPVSTYGVVSPFRYLELAGLPSEVTLTTNDVTQWRLQTEFDDEVATFSSSSTALNQVWALCKYSMKALSFDGIYVDGDRERTPYEADTYLHQLSSYGVNYDFTMPRCSFEYLTKHLTWPTEWPMHMVFIAWADYQQTGDPYLITKYYGFLTNKCLLAGRGDPVTGLVRSWPVSGNSISNPSDIIDWYRISGDGVGNTDGYVASATNAVINAFYYRCLTIMSQIAQLTGHEADRTDFLGRASLLYTNYNNILWDSTSQSYLDGVGISHSSINANFFPLVFGLVPTNRAAALVSYIDSRIAVAGGMPVGVYGAQYMLEGLFQAGEADMALGLMTTNNTRSWMNMIRTGATITTEAWSTADKPNEDWNHAWGAAPGNLIPRYVLGLRPLAAGYARILIQPQLGQTLTYAQGTVPTIRGPVSIEVSNKANIYQILLTIPGNVTAEVMLPTGGGTNAIALVDGAAVSGMLSNNWLTITNLGSGQHAVWLSNDSVVSANTLFNNWAAGWFGTNVTNPEMSGPSADADGDGVSNYSEFVAGTNPTEAADRFHIAAISNSPVERSFNVTVVGKAGRRYLLQHASVLNPASWTVVDLQTAIADNQTIVLCDSILPGSQQMFLRVAVSYP